MNQYQQIHENPPAFPKPIVTDTEISGSFNSGVGSIHTNMRVFDHAQDGMSLRDYYAGQALVGILASLDRSDIDFDHVGKLCYSISDGMLAARAQAQGPQA